MDLLLDTHIWLWSFLKPERVGKRVLQEMRNPENKVWLSPVSTWEALTSNAKGRIHLPADVAAWIYKATAPLLEAPFTHEIAVASSQLSWIHKDPADRLLAATAKLLRLTLVTADANMLGLGDISTLSNR